MQNPDSLLLILMLKDSLTLAYSIPYSEVALCIMPTVIFAASTGYPWNDAGAQNVIKPV